LNFDLDNEQHSSRKKQYLHLIRQREFKSIFRGYPAKSFNNALEIGAGDGYQSNLLKKYARRIYAIDPAITPTKMDKNTALIFYKCKAEKITKLFKKKSFDLVFSSNVLEHLADPGSVLRRTRLLLTDSGLAVHVVPAPFWKIANFILYYFYGGTVLISNWFHPDQYRDAKPQPEQKNKAPLKQLFFPPVHGAAGGHLSELLGFRRSYWRKLFLRAGFRIIKEIKGPVCSGYGLRWDILRSWLEKCGLASEYIFIIQKDL
jgi:2-polyprenyl-3-methyl-5-hydroxy-6-metoxy-1,4-benzoquinol methylase